MWEITIVRKEARGRPQGVDLSKELGALLRAVEGSTVQFSSTIIHPLLWMGKPRHRRAVGHWPEVTQPESGRARIPLRQSEARAYTLKHMVKYIHRHQYTYVKT